MRLALALSLLTTPVFAQCGAPLPQFLDGIRAADRAQGVFQKDFISFSRALISQNRIDNGRVYGNRFDATFDRIEAQW